MNISLKKHGLLSAISAGMLLMSASAFALNPGDPGDGDPNPCETNCGFEVGPDPTVQSMRAENGPFSWSTVDVGSGNGFAGGTIYYPEGLNRELAAVAVVPGFVSPESSIEWWGKQLASHGFVAITIATNTPFDLPSARASQLNAALDYILEQDETSGSAINGMVDESRLGVVGWSMGGGGALRVAQEDRISAAIPLAAWDSVKDVSNVRVPTMMFVCEDDVIAPNDNHSYVFWDGLPDGIDKGYLEFANEGHYCANGNNENNAILSQAGISWMKRHLDKDHRYSQFLCDTDYASEETVLDYRENCPF